MNYFFLIKDGKKYYLCNTDDLLINLKRGKLKYEKRPFFKYEKRFFSTKIESDEIHSIIKNELAKLVFELNDSTSYSYDEMIMPLLREAKLKEIGL
jgi:hypothetical protein